MDDKEDLIELRTLARMNELRINALLDLLSKEGVVNRDEFEERLNSLCDSSEEE